VGQIGLLVVVIACIAGIVKAWIPSTPPKKPVEKIGSTVLLGLLAVLCGALAIAPDAVLKMLGFGN
jgi:hypothetical protein